VTWMRFVLYEVLTGEEAEFGQTNRVIPYIGDHRFAPPTVGHRGRLIYTHEPFPDRSRRVIHLVRDARSVALSEYRWLVKNHRQTGGLDQFLDAFLHGRSNPWGSWDAHTRTWLDYAAANSSDTHTVRFEDMRADTLARFRGILKFLGKDPDQGILQNAILNNSADHMRQKGARRRFRAQGSIAPWREEMSPAQIQQIETCFAFTLSELGYLA
jgi:hypothetical protein